MNNCPTVNNREKDREIYQIDREEEKKTLIHTIYMYV